MRDSYLTILIIALLIASLGVVSIYSSTYQKYGKPWEDIYKRQILWIILGLISFALVSNLHYRRLWDWTFVLYAAAIFFLLLVLGLGLVRMGAQRWLKIAWFNFQPSEFTKLVTVIFLSRYFSRKSSSDTSILTGKFGVMRGIILPFMFVALPALMIMEQPDLGSAMIIIFLFMALLYLTGVKLRYIFLFFAILIIPLPFMWNLLHDYQRQRLLVFVNPNIDPLGAGYTVIQDNHRLGMALRKGLAFRNPEPTAFSPRIAHGLHFCHFCRRMGVFR
jgi:rod shape determining protein RodA